MDNLYKNISVLLRHVKHPSRYIGSEFSTSKYQFSDDDFNFCMVYPDLYDVGQSNQALRILCNCINNQPGLSAQRAFLPDAQTIKYFKDNNIPMFSLETFSPLKQFDAIGITVSHELLATNVLEVLDFSGIEIFTDDRKDDDPYVFGGGPVSCNPEPFWKFFDIITIGEGEIATINAVKKLKSLKESKLSRQEILHEIAKMDSIYVPSMYELCDGVLVPKYDDINMPVTKALYDEFSTSNAFENCIVPYVEIVHDRLNVEITRGCARGCRFCQAGFMYRPIRERSKENICKAVYDGLKQTGYDEVSLTSLSTTDHSQIEEILQDLNTNLKDKAVRVSIPSQRLDSFGLDMAKLVAGNKKGGLTFAIEAGSQRLRDVIDKNLTKENIFDAVKLAFKNGWNRAKLYFMVGLPTETDEDLIAISNLCEEILQTAKKSVEDKRKHGISISVSCAIFVPKPQTPFMFDGQISIDEAIRRINLIRHNIHSKAINFSWHSPQTSQIEAVLSRGTRDCADLIYAAWKNGAKFDAWLETFNFDAWKDAAKELNLDLEQLAGWNIDYKILNNDNLDKYLPWSHIDFGVDPNYFISERIKADKCQTTPDCTIEKCTNCGVCKNLGSSNNICESRKC